MFKIGRVYYRQLQEDLLTCCNKYPKLFFFIIISLNSTETGGVFWLYFRLLGTILKIIFRYFSVFFGFWSGNWRGLFEILAGIF
nr:MAG TPA: hypothetical protein [Caudoviricetes sp.]